MPIACHRLLLRPALCRAEDAAWAVPWPGPAALLRGASLGAHALLCLHLAGCLSSLTV